MREVDLALVIGLVHREIDDPGELELGLVGQAQLFADHVARTACDALKTRRRAAEEEGRIALAQTQLRADRLGPLGADVLGQRPGTFERAVLALAPEDVAHARQALFLGELVHPVAELARAARGSRDRADFGAILLEQFREDREARVAEVIGDHLHLDRVAQVGLVGAVFKHRLGIGNARPVRIDRTAIGEFLEHALDDRLHHVEDVFLLDEAHLHVQLVEVGGRAVGARVFVTEARRDLEILVEAADHDQLLELLRRLRQRVELARMQTRRHEEVARAFGRRRGDDRRLELVEIGVPHAFTHGFHDVGAQDHLVMQALATQVEEAIGQTGLFGIFQLAEDRQRQFLGLAQDFDIADIDLDLAGRDLRVDQALVAQFHGAVDADHPFRARFFHRLEGGAVAVTEHLRHTVMIAKIDEEHPPVIAHAMDPARKADGLTGVGGAQICAGMAAKGMHGRLPGSRIAYSRADTPVERAKVKLCGGTQTRLELFTRAWLEKM